MATIQEKQSFMSNMAPLKEDANEEDDIDYHEESFLGRGCCCFKFISFKRRRSDKNERGNLLQQRGEIRETWWAKNLKEVKEASEVLAGPKWKTLIRKIGGYFNNKKHNKNQFQYDPQSYALNFDGGVDREEDGLLRDFSVRFAPRFSDEQGRTGS
ncbi:hypothetical protein L1049_000114 [Liquidambar formosana]|uniref:Stress induced protein n=1 Tax=Liquidambar formosana TaxID=63359 RepID=A0AAP0R4L0_LIQFO